MTSSALVFQNTSFDIIDRNNQPWLRGYQIGSALGYTQPDAAISKLYSRNADEFTDGMTSVIKLPSTGGEQEVRVFSLRGCYALAMFAKTAIGKEFRKWVLDILDKETQPAALPVTISPMQKRALQEIVSARARDYPKGQQATIFKTLWGSLKTHYQVSSYAELPAHLMQEACVFLAKVELTAPALPSPDLSSAFMPVDGRYLVSVENGRALNPLPVPLDACVMTVPDMLKAINEPNGMFVDTKTLFEFVAATVNRLAQRCEYYETKSKGMPVKLAM